MRSFDDVWRFGEATLDRLFTGTSVEGPIPGVALCGGALIRAAIGAPPADFDILVPSGEYATLFVALADRGVCVKRRDKDGVTWTRNEHGNMEHPDAAITLSPVNNTTQAASFQFHTGEKVDIIEYPTKHHDTRTGALLAFLDTFDIRLSMIAVPWDAPTLLGPGVDDLLGWSHVVLRIINDKPTTADRLAKYRKLLDEAGVPSLRYVPPPVPSTDPFAVAAPG